MDTGSTPQVKDPHGDGSSAATAVDPERERLLLLVHDALEHLYDYVFLQSHPLNERLGNLPSEWNRGAALHRLLVETIEQLKPTSGTPAHSHLWRRYRHA